MAGNNKVKEVQDSKKNNGFIELIKGLKAEFKRITWAPKKDVKKATAAVVSFCLLYIIIVGILDTGFNSICKIIFR